MATRAELEQARRALNRISAAAAADLAGVLSAVDLSNVAAAERVLVATYPTIIDVYGTASAALAADLAEMWAEELRTRPQLTIASPATPARATGSVRWALAQPDVRGNLTLATDRLVKQPYRDTIQATAHASRLGWARVPMGATTCAFCVMAASRGAVFRSASSAGADAKYHGDCDCQVVMVRNPSDYPEGYDPAAYMDVYMAARDVADAEPGSTTTKSILAAMRQVGDLA